MDNGPQKLVVGIADMKMAQRGGELITYALGSCIGICLYDPAVQLAALIHIMLPLNMEAGRKNPMKYADSGIRETLRQMEGQGGLRPRITAKIAGGARMFEVSGGGSLGNIGQRNIESVHLILKRENIRLLAEDTGGTIARTLSFNPTTGQGRIRSYGKPELVF
ncbi:MAG: chemotaxis protein CheD [Lawsonibacter sp.]|nr:chemotaxis protein CheD [Lawsonibacter sp.]